MDSSSSPLLFVIAVEGGPRSPSSPQPLGRPRCGEYLLESQGALASVENSADTPGSHRCLLPLPGPLEPHGSAAGVVASKLNRRGTDPYARWCGRGAAARPSPIPIAQGRTTLRDDAGVSELPVVPATTVSSIISLRQTASWLGRKLFAGRSIRRYLGRVAVLHRSQGERTVLWCRRLAC